MFRQRIWKAEIPFCSVHFQQFFMETGKRKGEKEKTRPVSDLSSDCTIGMGKSRKLVTTKRRTTLFRRDRWRKSQLQAVFLNYWHLLHSLVCWGPSCLFQTWPKEVPNLKTSTMTFYEAMKKVARYMFRMLAMSLDLEVRFVWLTERDSVWKNGILVIRVLKLAYLAYVSLPCRTLSISTSITTWGKPTTCPMRGSCATLAFQKVHTTFFHAPFLLLLKTRKICFWMHISCLQFMFWHINKINISGNHSSVSKVAWRTDKWDAGNTQILVPSRYSFKMRMAA